MEAKVFAIKDVQLDMFYQPMFLASEVLAVRSLYMAMDNEKAVLQFFPENYFLMELGTWDDQTGRITMHDTPRVVISASTIMDKINLERKRKASLNANTEPLPSK